MKRKYRIGPYVDLVKSPVTLPEGTVLDEKRAEESGEEIARKHLRGRRCTGSQAPHPSCISDSSPRSRRNWTRSPATVASPRLR
jgi:hypothetical protein